MPGAELVEAVDESAWKARIRVKLGPMSLVFLTDVTRDSVDDAAHCITLAASAREERGRGSARARIESSLAAVDGGTQVKTVTDLTLSGSVAQFGRGMVQDVAAQLLKQFAACLERELTETLSPAQPAASSSEGPPSASADPPQPASVAAPISGLKLLSAVIRSRIARLLERLTRRGEGTPPTQP
jgi:carbon monoxide dehydrogenase subunit G